MKTSDMVKFKFEKLVRDKIPEFLSSKGIEANIKSLDSASYTLALKNKLIEECYELLSASNHENLLEELSDFHEVICGLLEAYGYNYNDLLQATMNKKKKLGGFNQRIYINYVEMCEGNTSINYYRNRPDAYPEIA